MMAWCGSEGGSESGSEGGARARRPKMPTAGVGGRIVVPTELLFLLGTPQRLISKALSFAKFYLTS